MRSLYGECALCSVSALALTVFAGLLGWADIGGTGHRAHACVRVHTHTRTRTRTRAHTRVSVETYAHVHTRTHAYTQSGRRAVGVNSGSDDAHSEDYESGGAGGGGGYAQVNGGRLVVSPSPPLPLLARAHN